MFVALTEILRDQLFQSAQPLALAGAEQVATTRVRWVHPSEVVQVGGLLHGDELLLTTGAALLGLRIEAQHAYLQSLVQRGVAALVIEPPADGPTISAKFIQRAEELGLPLFRLRAPCPLLSWPRKSTGRSSRNTPQPCNRPTKSPNASQGILPRPGRT
ncbi:PucR family transcriptional regulator ligand-binding domain-containing protein [Arthrobacter sp. JCM 19049]|uniref:PucR family transcriptional regulator ligand-binding domain-containing protein n=1 Tax=Arthrobacter sp. JCM 19049 TaxID=1460643 RepID=UPI000AFF29F5|nr:PucR family transcriptional regulator ligand-binding domain-containing protein [Arthrobacter sp. JCM 19049]